MNWYWGADPDRFCRMNRGHGRSVSGRPYGGQTEQSEGERSGGVRKGRGWGITFMGAGRWDLHDPVVGGGSGRGSSYHQGHRRTGRSPPRSRKLGPKITRKFHQNATHAHTTESRQIARSCALIAFVHCCGGGRAPSGQIRLESAMHRGHRVM
jgi:hypothetical protein